MHWAAEKYKIWVITTHADTRLYLWETWKDLFPYVDKIVGLASGPAAIRTSQAFEDESGWLGFGRMVWSDKNNRKWTQKYRSEEFSGKELRFFDMEVWSPDWNRTWKNNEAPELLVKLDNSSINPDHEQGLMIAIRTDVAKKYMASIETAIKALMELIPDPVLTIGIRSWGEEIYDVGYSNGLSDADSNYLAKQIGS